VCNVVILPPPLFFTAPHFFTALDIKCAIKIFEGKEETRVSKSKIANEALMMKLLSGPSSYRTIIDCYGFVHSFFYSWIIMELAPFGSIDKLLVVEHYSQLQ